MKILKIAKMIMMMKSVVMLQNRTNIKINPQILNFNKISISLIETNFLYNLSNTIYYYKGFIKK